MLTAFSVVVALLSRQLPAPGIVPEPIVVPPPVAPYVLRHGPATLPVDQRRSVGLLYPPRVLAALAARARAEGRIESPLVTRAIQDGTPVVVLWRMPKGPFYRRVRWQPFYRASVTPPGGNEEAPSSPKPLWTVDNASWIRALDRQAVLEPVALVAAFDRQALRPGYWLYLWRNGLGEEPWPHISERIWADIPDWR